MKNKQIQTTAVIFGILSLAYSIYSFYIYYGIFNSISAPFASDKPIFPKVENINFVVLHLTLTPMLFILASVSSIGLYKLKRWGSLLATISIVSYILIFIGTLITHFNPEAFETSIKINGWFIFYHMEINIETILPPIISIVFLIIFNLKLHEKKI